MFLERDLGVIVKWRCLKTHAMWKNEIYTYILYMYII